MGYFKRLVLAIMLLGVFALPASAQALFSRSYGQWQLEAHVGPRPFCHAKTIWPDGTWVSVVRYTDGELAMMAENPDWTIGDPLNAEYVSVLEFSGSINAVSAHRFTLLAPNRIVFRRLDGEFARRWIGADRMKIVMPGNIPDLMVGLEGTDVLATDFVACVRSLSGTPL